MKNEDAVCTILRKRLDLPDHVPNHVVLDLTKETFDLASAKLEVNWNDFKNKMSVPLKKIINIINGEEQ